MRTLYLLRHAKSSWASPLLDDFERPLNKRGREAAPRIGRLLRKREMIPDLVLCSAARRATETWELAGQAIGRDLPVKVYRGLYLASAGKILDIVRRAADEAESLLVVGHNPGMERCAAQLVGPGSDAGALAELEAKYPTAAVAAFTFDAEKWRDLDFGAGRLIAFLKPQD
jgi:phosphohistidine phosphatase